MGRRFDAGDLADKTGDRLRRYFGGFGDGWFPGQAVCRGKSRAGRELRSLDHFKGLDQIGETGLTDEVNRHYLQVFGASVAIGALSGLAQYGSSGGLGATTFADQYRQTAGASLAGSSGRVLDRYLNVLPTITIREGYRIKVYLTNDLELPAYHMPETQDRSLLAQSTGRIP